MVDTIDDFSKQHSNDNDENFNDKASWKNTWKCLNALTVLSGESSVHAVSHVGQAKTKGSKTFWTLILILCVCSCIYEVNSFMTIYFQYPVLIDVEMQNNRSSEFPAVTVCNLNRMKRNHVDCVQKNQKWADCGGMAIRTRTLVFSERKKITSVSNITTAPERNYQLKSQDLLNHYTNLDASSRKCYGHRLHELIKSCSFNSVVCNHRDFAYFHSIQYGNCFTFNKKLHDHEDPLLVHNIGPNSGLELDLDIQISSYLDITPSSGLRVVLHNPSEDPNPGENGINISPGYETQVSVIKTSIQRLPPPYRDRCREYRVFDVNGTSTRSQFDCIRVCMQQTSLSLCGCVDPFLPTVHDVARCDLKNRTQMLCLDTALEDMSKNGLPCECPLPCLSTTYDMQVSTTLLSSPTSVSSEDFGWSPDPYCDSWYAGVFKRDSTQYITSSFLKGEMNMRRSPGVESKALNSKIKLKVFYGSFEHNIYSQKPMFSEAEFYGQLGGNLSLWLGLSVVALYEYIEKLLYVIHFIVQKKTVIAK